MTNESQLADLGFRLFAPPPALRPFVRSLWAFRRDAPLAAYREEFMHPRGGFGLVFNFGGDLLLDGAPVRDPIFLTGTTTVSRRMGFLGRVDMLGVRFWEGGAFPVLGLPLAELRDQVRILEAPAPPGLVELYLRMHVAGSTDARLRMAAGWLAARMADGRERHQVIPASLTMLRESAGRLAIPRLADACAISQRQLERLYQSQVGMSPKEYARLLRVDGARLALKRLGGRATAEVAAELGFYDQSHFIHEFRAVVGMTPAAYARRGRG